MDIRFTLAAVAHVPVYYWPWVWWQLFWLRGEVAATGRDVLYEIDGRGRVHVVMVADAPDDLRAWLGRRQREWRDHWDAMNDASGERHLSPIHYWMGRIMECGERVVWVSSQNVMRSVPAVCDTS